MPNWKASCFASNLDWKSHKDPLKWSNNNEKHSIAEILMEYLSVCRWLSDFWDFFWNILCIWKNNRASITLGQVLIYLLSLDDVGGAKTLYMGFRLDCERRDWSEDQKEFYEDTVIGQFVCFLPSLTAVRQRALWSSAVHWSLSATHRFTERW